MSSMDEGSLHVQSIVLDQLLDDPQTKEIVVMEVSRLNEEK